MRPETPPVEFKMLWAHYFLPTPENAKITKSRSEITAIKYQCVKK